MRECQLSDGEGVMGEEGQLTPSIGAPYSYGGMLWLRCLGICVTEWEGGWGEQNGKGGGGWGGGGGGGGTEWELVEQNGMT